MTTVKTNSVALTVTSPPYFRHRDYGAGGQIGQERTLDVYLSRMRGVFEQLLRVTTRTGSCFVVVGDTYQARKLLLVPHRLAILASDVGWTVRNDLIWNKLDPAPDSATNRWRAGHEHILFLTKKPSDYVFHDEAVRVPYAPDTIRRWGKGQQYGGKKSEGRSTNNEPRLRHGRSFALHPKGCVPTDVWTLPSGNSHAGHYAAFDLRLVTRMIEACSNPGDLVLDPFLGSGTTAIAALSLGRRALGIEINPEYAELAQRAIDEFLSSRVS